MAKGAAAGGAKDGAAAAADGEVVEFGWEEERSDKPLTGRRKKAAQEQKKKNRSGTFGGLKVEGLLCSLSQPLDRTRAGLTAWVWLLPSCVESSLISTQGTLPHSLQP